MSKKEFFINEDGILKMKNTTLFFINKNGETYIPIERINSIYFIGSGSVSNSVLKEFSRKGILLHYFGRRGEYIGTFYPKKSLVSGEMVVRQAGFYLNYEKRLFLAKSFIKGAFNSIKWVLEKHKLDKIDFPELDVDNISQLMQKEGLVRKKFYKILDDRLSEKFKIEKREIRPPSNRGNAILSFLNSLVYSEVASQIYYTHLNPSISFLHEPFERRLSLSLDISEIFKPILSEKLFLKMVNLKMLDPELDFEDKQGVFLSKIGRDKVLRVFSNEINKIVSMRRSRKKRSIRELIRLELYKIEKHFLEINKYKPLNPWW